MLGEVVRGVSAFSHHHGGKGEDGDAHFEEVLEKKPRPMEAWTVATAFGGAPTSQNR